MQHINKKDKELFKAVGSVIKKLREDRGLSLNIFAFENDLQKSLVSRLENGINEPKLTSLWKIAEALDINPSELIKQIESELPSGFSLGE